MTQITKAMTERVSTICTIVTMYVFAWACFNNSPWGLVPFFSILMLIITVGWVYVLTYQVKELIHLIKKR